METLEYEMQAMGILKGSTSRTAVSVLLGILLTVGMSESRANTIGRRFSEDSDSDRVAAQDFQSAPALGTSMTNTLASTTALTSTIPNSSSYSSAIPTVLNSGGRHANTFHSTDTEVAGLGARIARSQSVSGNGRHHRGAGGGGAVSSLGEIAPTGVPDSGSTLLLLGCAFGTVLGARRFFSQKRVG
jgi:hypothetical protein